MLNISEKSVRHLIDGSRFQSMRAMSDRYSNAHRRLVLVIIVLLLAGVLVMLMPWTQNVRAKGELIALQPGQRPQTIQSVIAGRIEQWYVQEGQKVEKGDTIVRLSEINEDYLDPQLLDNTNQQLVSKTASAGAYKEKANTLDNQLVAIEAAYKLKRQQAVNKVIQARLKVRTDSTDLIAGEREAEIASDQYQRMVTLLNEGLRALPDLENRRLKYQEAQAMLVARQNKLLTSRNELLNAGLELRAIDAEYAEKTAKTTSEKLGAMSGMYDAEATAGKLRNQYATYQVRVSFYYVIAPQAGYVTQARQAGIGETIKEGEEIVSIMPEKYDLAVQMYVRPIDLPLFEKGQKVMIQFDGWPAIIFSGWPGISYGTYEGEVLAIDNFISDNHLYRVLVKPRTGAHEWPSQLRVGAGIKAITLLKNVQVWYEIWRQINGFPPDYYKQTEKKGEKNEK
jgi:adhesin transport system membrane fusion protein